MGERFGEGVFTAIDKPKPKHLGCMTLTISDYPETALRTVALLAAS